MLKNLFFVSLLLLLANVSWAQNKSVETDLSYINCQRVDMNKKIPDVYFGWCAGVGDYKVEVPLDGVRNSFSLILPSNKAIKFDFWKYFDKVSTLEDKVEWRVKGKKPVAFIARLNVSEEEDEKEPALYLLVSKITKTSACVTDIVKPGPGQEKRARKLADKAAPKTCRKTVQ
jgi:hypothetical protein